jgi:hypothetical protein
MAPPGFEGVTRVDDPKAVQTAAKIAAASGGHSLPPGSNPLLMVGLGLGLGSSTVPPGLGASALPMLSAIGNAQLAMPTGANAMPTGANAMAIRGGGGGAMGGLGPMGFGGGGGGMGGNPITTPARQARRLYVGNLPEPVAEVCITHSLTH